MDKLKTEILTFFAGFLLGVFVLLFGFSDDEVSSSVSDRRVEVLLKNKRATDSIIKVMNDYVLELEKRTYYLRSERDSLQTDIDSILVRVDKLTDIKVTDKNIKEALEWIKDYNNSLE